MPHRNPGPDRQDEDPAATEAAEASQAAELEMFRRLGVSGKTVVIDVNPDERFVLSARNIAGVRLVSAARVTARDLMDTAHVIATREAIEKLQESLG